MRKIMKSKHTTYYASVPLKSFVGKQKQTEKSTKIRKRKGMGLGLI